MSWVSLLFERRFPSSWHFIEENEQSTRATETRVFLLLCEKYSFMFQLVPESGFSFLAEEDNTSKKSHTNKYKIMASMSCTVDAIFGIKKSVGFEMATTNWNISIDFLAFRKDAFVGLTRSSTPYPKGLHKKWPTPITPFSSSNRWFQSTARASHRIQLNLINRIMHNGAS